MRKQPTVFFDKNDYRLLEIVNDVLSIDSREQDVRSLLGEYLHPHGIKEMAAAQGLRIAYAIASLLGSLESGKASDRLVALRSLRDEVLDSSSAVFQKNSARALLQIMKELLRCRDDELRQLKLAHDFRMVLAGNPRKVRKELAKYHLLEMPEEWNQFAFDDHVHDANTKGRKTPTHLVMDAWIKGIRHLTVVYYNYVQPEVVDELLEASSILDLKVQVGIEMSARFRNKYIRFTWEPHGFPDNNALSNFLQGNAVKQLVREGREVSCYQQKYVFEVLEVFNLRHRHTLNAEFGLSIPECRYDAFHSFVGTGQPSLLHLARFIQNNLVNEVKQKIGLLKKELRSPEIELEDKAKLTLLLKQMSDLNVERIINDFLLPAHNPELHDPHLPNDSVDLPSLLKLRPLELLNRLQSLHPSSKFTLNLSNLSVQDTMELLYAGEGIITHIEAYNLKNAAYGINSSGMSGLAGVRGETVDLTNPATYYDLIGDLRRALNDDNVITLKRVLRAIIWDYEEQLLRVKKSIEIHPKGYKKEETLTLELHSMTERKQELIDILYNLEKFHTFYKKKTLGARIGSGSTGQAEHSHGMGFVVIDTLPQRAQKAIRSAVAAQKRIYIPVSALLTRNIHDRRDQLRSSSWKGRLGRMLPSLQSAKHLHWSDWSLDRFMVHSKRKGNIVTLGGHAKNGGENANGSPFSKPTAKEQLGSPWKYLNTNLKNWLKVTLGFIPAFLTFSLTKEWWLLAYFGAVIWFAITGSRNIIQSVLGGGGLRRSPLLPWNSLISWSRIADSLLYTGFSVPLLDFLVKTLLLDNTFGITTTTNPVLLYAVMGLANGIYISSHNVVRGLPRSATVGNFFRSIIAIPVAILLNTIIGSILSSAGVPAGAEELQKWAAIISKFASDCVAGVIEGVADRQSNIRASLADYRKKISQLFGVFSRLDLQFPEEDVLEIMQSPKMMMQTLDYEARDQEKLIIVNALDLMYFWMYQPRARKALRNIAGTMSREEWLIFYRSQLILKQHKEISQVFVSGLVGKNFARPLSFYLDRAEEYLADMEHMERSINAAR